MFAGVGERTREGNDFYHEMEDSKVLDKVAMVFGPDERTAGQPSARGADRPHHGRDSATKDLDILFFVDNIYRYTLAGTEVSALLGRMPSAVGYQPTLAEEWAVCRAHHVDQDWLDHLDPGRVRACRRLTDPSPATTFAHLDATVVLSRDIAALGIFPPWIRSTRRRARSIRW